MPSATNQPPFREGESWILKTAWDRLNLEGSLPPAWPESAPEARGVRRRPNRERREPSRMFAVQQAMKEREPVHSSLEGNLL